MAAIDLLNPRQRKFVLCYIHECKYNATKAYKAAGYSEKGARTGASLLLANPNIQAAIEEQDKIMLREHGITGGQVIKELKDIAFSDIRDYYDEDGNLLPIKDLETEAATAAREIDTHTQEVADIHTTSTKLKLHDKIRALDLLGRRLRLWDEDGQQQEITLNLHLQDDSAGGENGHERPEEDGAGNNGDVEDRTDGNGEADVSGT